MRSRISRCPLDSGAEATVENRFPCAFFFQAEDGIRDHCVTRVQTCALPICYIEVPDSRELSFTGPFTVQASIKIENDAVQQAVVEKYDEPGLNGYALRLIDGKVVAVVCNQIGRASCRERWNTWMTADEVDTE